MERQATAAANSAWPLDRQRLQGEVATLNDSLTAQLEAHSAAIRESSNEHLTRIAQLRREFDQSQAEATRRHEMAAGILREKVLSRTEEAQSAGEQRL